MLEKRVCGRMLRMSSRTSGMGSRTSGMCVHVSSYYYICVLILLYMCPHTTTMYVSSCYYVCVLILLYMCPHTTIYVSSYCCICVLILLLYMCPHATMYVSSYYYMCPHTTIYVSSYYYICILILLYVSSYYYICVLILLYMCPQRPVLLTKPLCSHTTILLLTKPLCPHTSIYVSSAPSLRRCAEELSVSVSSYYYMCVLSAQFATLREEHTAILLLTKPLCPHTTIYVSSAPSSRRCARSSARSGWAAKRSRGRCASSLNASQHTSAYVIIRQHTSLVC
jgi:hypothetical protein